MGNRLGDFICCAVWVSLLLPSTEALPESEKRALLGLKEMLQQEGEAALLSEWGGETDFCNLKPKEATTSSEGTVYVGCEDGYVKRIEMTGSRKGGGGGSGSVSSEALALHLTNFTKLTDVRLISLGIGGPLSSKFGRLAQLQSLNLSSNSITGSFPTRLLSLRSLHILAIDDNLLNGTLPQQWRSLHSNLSTLSLSHNQIHGAIPADLFSSLRSLHLDGNLIAGSLPPSLSSSLSLLSLSLSGNQISGTLPDFPPHLILLSVANNRLHGHLPSSISLLSTLQYLDLSGNQLTGVPPPDLFSLPRLLSFNVARNRLSGSFSPNLTLSDGLKSMDFSFNLMTGNLPDAMVRSLLSKGAEIRFQGNCLSTDLQPQNPFAYCQNAALASGLASDLRSVEKHRKVHNAAIAAIAVAIAIAAVIVVVFTVLFVVHRRRSRSRGDLTVPVKYLRGGGGGDDGRKRPCMGQKSVDVSSEMLSNARYISRTMKLGGLGFPQFRVFSMDELYRATDYFHESTLIGQGSHGKVYKGQLDDGTLIAIKRLGSKEGGVESQADAWKARVERLGKCRHKHVVALLGYNMTMVEPDESEKESGGGHGAYGRNHRERMIQMSLVYEYVGDRTLSKKLAGKRLEGLGWVHRLKVIIGAAKGVHFLHFGSVPGIFNNDISTTNILLDQNWVPKISDFGLSLRQPSSSSLQSPQAPSKSSRRLYIDENKTRKGVDDKDDIYSFGLVLLEVLTGRPPSSGVHGGLAPKELESLVGVGYGSRVECIDPRIAGVCNMESLETVIDITIKCLCEDPMGRPSMEDVLWNLQYALQVQSSSASMGGSHEDLTDGLCADGPKTELLFPSRSRRKNMANIERIYSEELGKPSSPNTDFFR